MFVTLTMFFCMVLQIIYRYLNKMLGYCRETELQGAIVLAKSGRLELGDSILRTFFNRCDIISLQSYRIPWKKQNKGYYVVQGHRGQDQSKARMQRPVLLVINSNWHPVSYCFGVIAAYCWNFGQFAFLSHLLGHGDNVWYSSWAHWKVRSEPPISVNWSFLLGVTAEKIDGKLAISLQHGQFDPKF